MVGLVKPVMAPDPLAPAPRRSPLRSRSWACRACGKSHDTRARATACCADQVLHPPAVEGGELILPGHRTHEEVIEQLEARMQELEQQARALEKAPPSPYPCAECKWRAKWPSNCEQPLVKGFEDKAMTMDWYLKNQIVPRLWESTALCGREKALWEPNLPPPLTRWQHLLKAIFG